MNITRESKLFDILEEYPFLEEKIIGVAPPFKNLKNPVLRCTVGKLATIEKVAEIGGVDVTRFVNALRQAAGQPELLPEDHPGVDISIPRSKADPEWIAGKPEYIINGSALLDRGDVPLLKVNELLQNLTPAGYLLLVTNFEPIPILEAMQKQNRRVSHKVNPEDGRQYLTFIQ
jgi:hypothetical protein